MSALHWPEKQVDDMDLKRMVILAMAALVAIVVFMSALLLVLYEPAITTVYSEYSYTHDAARNVTVNVSCEFGNSPQQCPVTVYNSTSDMIILTIKTVVPKSAEYKGNEKVFEYFKREVRFTEVNDTLHIDVTINGGSETFLLRPPWAGVDIYVPEGTNYRINGQ